MLRIETCDEVRSRVLTLRGQGKTMGLVPTMGALHDGHLSLVRQSTRSCDETVASIFVNPTQFAPDEDLKKYPRTLDQDLDRLRDAGTTMVFVPSVSQMYPEGFSTFVEPPAIARSLEGLCRPGHYRGVVTVVLKLFAAMPVTDAFFGQKDFQQFKVIEAMARDLNLGINLHACETVREPDGLAMSSRNRYLSKEDRIRGLAISKALQATGQAVESGNVDVSSLMQEMARHLHDLDRIDYATIVDAVTLEPIDTIGRDAVALIAAYVGETRLIDNRLLSLTGTATRF